MNRFGVFVIIKEIGLIMNKINNKIKLHISKGDTSSEYAKATERFFAGFPNKDDIFKTITKDEELEAIEKYKDDRAELENFLITHNIFLAVNMASKYQKLYTNYDDLLSSAMYGLVEAAKQFDVSKKNRFCTYASFWIKNYILRPFNVKKIKHIENHSSLNLDKVQVDEMSNDDKSVNYTLLYNNIHHKVYDEYHNKIRDSYEIVNENETNIFKKSLAKQISSFISTSSLSDDYKKVYKIIFVDGDSAVRASNIMNMRYNDIIKIKNIIKKYIIDEFSVYFN